MSTLYETDFYTWTQQQAQRLRQGPLSELDLEHLAEEIESMGKRDRRALGSQLRNILLHLLKWRFQPLLRGPSWRRSIRTARLKMDDILQDSPSLRRHLPNLLAKEYSRAVAQAVDETGLRSSDFPNACPWPLEQILDEDFWPD